MKILQVITSLRIGGAEKLIVEMAPLLREKGHQVDVLLFDGVETHLKSDIQKMGFHVYQLSTNRSVYNPIHILKLIPYLRKYDIIHTHNTACQYYVALAKLFVGNHTRLVTTEHNTTNRRRSIPGFKYIDRFMYSRYQAIISISHKATTLLEEYLGTTKKTATIPNGINLQSYRNAVAVSKYDLNLDSSIILITMVAGFREQKDQDTLIRAMSLLPADYCLYLVGDGVRENVCEELAKSLDIEDRVIFAGIRNDIPQILKASDIIVLSSHWEGLSLSCLEGMASGKPFIASDVNGLREVVEGAGILFPEGNAEQLASEIKHLTDDPIYYQKIARQCEDRASEFDINRTVNAYNQIYENVL